MACHEQAGKALQEGLPRASNGGGDGAVIRKSPAAGAANSRSTALWLRPTKLHLAARGTARSPTLGRSSAPRPACPELAEGARARRCQEVLEAGEVASVTELAERLKVDGSCAFRALPALSLT